MAFLAPHKYFIQMDEGWSDFDLKIARGLWSRAYLLVCAENHGGENRVLRVRCSMRPSRLASFMLRCWAGGTAIALIAGLPVAAIIFGLAGLANLAIVVEDTVKFGEIMHRVVEHVARDGKLIPLSQRAKA
jgi:hypothetical protein